jgi:hypothetical protein
MQSYAPEKKCNKTAESKTPSDHVCIRFPTGYNVMFRPNAEKDCSRLVLYLCAESSHLHFCLGFSFSCLEWSGAGYAVDAVPGEAFICGEFCGWHVALVEDSV